MDFGHLVGDRGDRREPVGQVAREPLDHDAPDGHARRVDALPVDAKTNETPIAATVLRGLVLEGRVVTIDALLTQRAVARVVLLRRAKTLSERPPPE